MDKFISIIIPVYNEKDNIKNAIAKTEKVLKYPHEILVIYDFEEDNTVPVVKSLLKKFKNIQLLLNKDRGLINAIKLGIKKSKGDAIVFLSPDDADEPATINKMYAKIKEGFDVVCASRYSKNGKRINQSSLKMYLSKVAGFATPLMLGIPTVDITNGFKMFRSSVIKKIPIKSTGGWEFSMELTIKAHNKNSSVVEVGSVSKERKHGNSKFKLLHWLPKYIYWYSYGTQKNFHKKISKLKEIL